MNLKHAYHTNHIIAAPCKTRSDTFSVHKTIGVKSFFAVILADIRDNKNIWVRQNFDSVGEVNTAFCNILLPLFFIPFKNVFAVHAIVVIHLQ